MAEGRPPTRRNPHSWGPTAGLGDRPPVTGGPRTSSQPGRPQGVRRGKREGRTMSWRIRHEGSPRAVEGLTLSQIVQGLQDGAWEPTDEVRGPKDTRWVAIENHPQLEEVAA